MSADNDQSSLEQKLAGMPSRSLNALTAIGMVDTLMQEVIVPEGYNRYLASPGSESCSMSPKKRYANYAISKDGKSVIINFTDSEQEFEIIEAAHKTLSDKLGINFDKLGIDVFTKTKEKMFTKIKDKKIKLIVPVDELIAAYQSHILNSGKETVGKFTAAETIRGAASAGGPTGLGGC